MDDKVSAILFAVFLGLFTVIFCIRLFVKRRKYAYCPKCDGKTKLKWTKKEVERSMRDRIRRNYHQKTAYAVYLVIRCEHCGHEIRI